MRLARHLRLWCGSLGRGRCRGTHGSGPVSYTHLDVYKRQVVGTVLTGYVAGQLSDRFKRRKPFVIGSAMWYAVSLVFLSLASPDNSGLPMALVVLFLGCLLYTSRCV